MYTMSQNKSYFNLICVCYFIEKQEHCKADHICPKQVTHRNVGVSLTRKFARILDNQGETKSVADYFT